MVPILFIYFYFQRNSQKHLSLICQTHLKKKYQIKLTIKYYLLGN